MRHMRNASSAQLSDTRTLKMQRLQRASHQCGMHVTHMCALRAHACVLAALDKPQPLSPLVPQVPYPAFVPATPDRMRLSSDGTQASVTGKHFWPVRKGGSGEPPTAFWGFAIVKIDLQRLNEKVLSKLPGIDQQRYGYRIYRPGNASVPGNALVPGAEGERDETVFETQSIGRHAKKTATIQVRAWGDLHTRRRQQQSRCGRRMHRSSA